MRHLIKRHAGVAFAGAARMRVQLSARRVGAAVVYHAVDERQGDAGRELLPPLGLVHFRRHLRHLRHYDTVTADEFLAAVAARRRGGRIPVCVTFDDDSVEHVRHALGALSEAGARATFFLNGSFLEGGFAGFWWMRLQRALDAGATIDDVAALLPRGERPRTLRDLGQAIERLPAAERDAVGEALMELAGPDPAGALMTAGEARRLIDAGHAIGFHTRRHYNLLTLDDEELELALSEGRAELSAFTGREVTAIAYPHGGVDERVAAAARRAGFTVGFTFRHARLGDPLLVGRLPGGPGTLSQYAWNLVRPML